MSDHITSTISKDNILINDLTAYVTIGSELWEREIHRQVLISIAITTNFATNNLNIKLVIDEIIKFCETNTFNWLNDLVIGLETLIKDKYYHQIFALEITAKQPFPTNRVKEIGAIIVRNYCNQP